jgi:hypothetical protein
VDENLDFFEADSEQVVLSGSVVLKEILHNLPPEDEARVLVLVRSANDSAKDVERYVNERTAFPRARCNKSEYVRSWNRSGTSDFGNKNMCSLRRVGSETNIDVRAEFVAF